jgi:2-dehydro-3-deoxyphosphogluconate aldolase/(4S)-4-hydroxy-2-oxoglutarate aldolase
MNPAFSFDVPIVGILRGFTNVQAERIVETALRGGLRNLEITMGPAETPQQIRRARELVNGGLNVGAGTVLNLQSLDRALSAGASFIVTPIVNEEVIAECVRGKIPVFPGAYSPAEILVAWELGATMVKVFPAETLGPAYIRSIKAPLPQVKLMPTGGVDLKTLPAFIKAGADGFGVGGPLFDRARVEAGDYAWIEEQCRAFVNLFRF